MHLQIGSFSRTPVPASAAADAKKGFEELLRIDFAAGRGEMEGSIAALEAAESLKSFEGVAFAELGVGVDSGVAVGVVALALFVVGEDFVGFGGFFEFFGGVFVVLLGLYGV